MAWKDVRITEDAHRAAKTAAAAEGSRLDEWLSAVVLSAAAEALRKDADAAIAAINGREAQEQR